MFSEQKDTMAEKDAKNIQWQNYTRTCKIYNGNNIQGQQKYTMARTSNGGANGRGWKECMDSLTDIFFKADDRSTVVEQL